MVATHGDVRLHGLVRRLRCPRCRQPLECRADVLSCPSGHRFPRQLGFFNLTSQPPDEVTARTLSSFGFEWNAFDRVQPEDEQYWHWYFADVPLDELRDALALDVGCGKGRFTQFTARHVAAIAALDGSEAVEAAARNLAGVENAIVLKADLREAPISHGSLDFICCLGVLHHLPDPDLSFARLSKLLAPGGRILVYVYSRPRRRDFRWLGLTVAAGLRRVTVRLPHRLLRVLAAPLGAALYAVVVIPGAVGSRLGWRRLANLPLSAYRRKPVRALWLDTFDRLSAPLEARFLPAEVVGWFTRAGLTVEALREDAGLFVLGQRSRDVTHGES